MREYQKNSFEAMSELDAQGMILWDSEGAGQQQYLGSPDVARKLMIQRDSYDFLDEFFHNYRARGYKVGCCVRAIEYDELTNTFTFASDPFETLLRKARYAVKRWGCRLFYVDSNYTRAINPDLIPATTYGRLMKELPGTLWIPESARHPISQDVDFDQYETSAPYMELRGKFTGTPSRVRKEIIGPFSVLNVDEGDKVTYRDEVRESLARGDVLMTGGWFKHGEWNDVMSLLRN